MATQRKVRRQSVSGRQAVIKHYSVRKWYEIPDWAKDWIIANAGWVTLFATVALAPSAILAFTLGLNKTPLAVYLGLPSSANDVGISALVVIVEIVLLALAIRPLFRREHRGWQILLAAAAVWLVHGIILGHTFSGIFVFLLVAYLYHQVRRYYS
jgi:hypothetical protein